MRKPFDLTKNGTVLFSKQVCHARIRFLPDACHWRLFALCVSGCVRIRPRTRPDRKIGPYRFFEGDPRPMGYRLSGM